MDVIEAIHTRSSVKSFKPEPVTDEEIETLLEAAVRAPNHRLTEPWRFYVLRGEAKRRFAELRREQKARTFEDPEAPEIEKALAKAYEDAASAAAIIVVTTAVADDPVMRDEDYAATCCAIQNMLLAAVSLGLGTYWRTGLLDPRLHDLMGADADERIVGTIFLGYPAEEPEPKPRTPASEKTRWVG